MKPFLPVKLLWLLLALPLLSGCPKPPTGALDAARDAVSGAADAERCAAEEYQEAQRLLESAEAALEAKDYKEAERLAEAAEQQAQRAQEAAEANREECERPAQTDPICGNGEQEQGEECDDGNAINGDGCTARCLIEVETEAPAPPHEYSTIYFDFDQYTLSPQSRSLLDQHAEALQENEDLSIVLEGHCDEAGSTEYNLALGERRARAVRDYLQRLGVEANRLRVISYGEERPVGSNAENRRVEFELGR